MAGRGGSGGCGELRLGEQALIPNSGFLAPGEPSEGDSPPPPPPGDLGQDASETYPCYNSLARNILLKMSSDCLGPGMGQQKQGSVVHSAGVRGVLSSLMKSCLCFLKFGNLVALCRLHWLLSTYASLGFRFL